MAVMENVKILNGVVRTVLATAVLGLAGFACWMGYTTYYQAELEAAAREKELSETKAKLEAQIKENERLNTAIRLLKVDTRIAEFEVLSRRIDPDTNKPLTMVRFVEVDKNRNPMTGTEKKFELQGEQIHVVAWVAKFNDKFVEEADLLRGQTLYLFKGIHGENTAHSEAFELDSPFTSPGAYSSDGQPNDFEKDIWEKFWKIANDTELQKKYGVRAAHGQTNYIQAEVGKKYILDLRSSDGLTLLPDGDQAQAPEPNSPVRLKY